MQEVEEITYGSWQTRYNGLTKEQAERLNEREEFASCELLEVEENIWRVDVEMRQVNKDIFQITQDIGREIGMLSLSEQGLEDIRPDGEMAEYDISYHMNLLSFYGLESRENLYVRCCLGC